MTGLCPAHLFLERADRFAIVSGRNCRDSGFERTGFLDAASLHVFEKLRPGFRLFDQIENGLGLGLVDGSSVPIVIIPDDHDVEDVAGDIAAQKGMVLPTACTLDLPPVASGGADIKESSKWPPGRCFRRPRIRISPPGWGSSE